MNVRRVFSAFLILVVAATAQTAAANTLFPHALRPVPKEVEQTCRHYVNRAKFKPRGEDALYITVLADSCMEAAQHLYVRIDTNPYAARQAEAYLAKLTSLKFQVIAMNMERAFGQGFHRRTQMKTSMDPRRPVSREGLRQVSPLGEFLIAREMGVMTAFNRWAFATGFKTLAMR